MFKKIVMTLSFLSSGILFAGTMGKTCTELNATVPCNESAWEFGAQANYLQIDSPALNLTGFSYQGDGTQVYNSYTAPYAWGFKVQSGYHFGTGSDVNLNWYYNQKTAAAVLSDVWTFKDNNWNAVNLEVGQKVNYGSNKFIRFHGGASYTRILVNLRKQGQGVLASSGALSPQTSNVLSSYSGFGPRIGADMNYTFNYGLGVYANGAGSLLVGPERFNNSMSLVGLPNTQNGGASTTLVPELEAKLGATYTHSVANGQLVVDAGWMWVNYFNAYLYDTSNRSVIGNQFTTLNDFTIQGPFAGLKWIGNIA